MLTSKLKDDRWPFLVGKNEKYQRVYNINKALRYADPEDIVVMTIAVPGLTAQKKMLVNREQDYRNKVGDLWNDLAEEKYPLEGDDSSITATVYLKATMIDAYVTISKKKTRYCTYILNTKNLLHLRQTLTRVCKKGN